MPRPGLSLYPPRCARSAFGPMTARDCNRLRFSGKRLPSFFSKTMERRAASAASSRCSCEFVTLAARSGSTYGVSNRPPLGSGPAHATVAAVPGLTDVDAKVLKLACETAIDEGEAYTDPPSVWKKAEQQGITEEQLSRGLFGPWTCSDRRLSFRWNPADDRRYAYSWDDPSDEAVRAAGYVHRRSSCARSSSISCGPRH